MQMQMYMAALVSTECNAHVECVRPSIFPQEKTIVKQQKEEEKSLPFA